MILTWNKIIEEVKSGNIIIDPFSIDQINPNSYNYRLWVQIKIFDQFDWENPIFITQNIPQDWIILKKGFMYLGSTYEKIWSTKYMTSLIWRSSMWRLGMFLQLSANIWHTWTTHNWTLEIYPTYDIKVYPWMIIGQVTFWSNYGEITLYDWKYKYFNSPQESLDNNYKLWY